MVSSSSQSMPTGELYINGAWVPCSSQMDVIDPTTELKLHQVAKATSAEVELACQAADFAFRNHWGKKSTAAVRAEFLRKMASQVENQLARLSRLETLDCGKPIEESEWDFEDVVACLRYYATLAEKLESEQQHQAVELADADYQAELCYEPMGVVAAVVPWNYPALMAIWKVAPALAAGCTVILKPSELTPLTALELARIAHDVGLPAGVLNVLTGDGPQTGEALINHPLVSKISFTGSVPTGSKIMAAAAKDIKNVSLELGGKSPAVVFDAHNIDRTIEWVMFGCFWTNGQICSATSRLLVHEDIADEFIKKLCEETSKIKIGNPLEKGVRLGPLVSKNQQLKVLSYIDGAIRQGAKIACGGSVPSSTSKGFYVQPTILTNVTSDMKVWREEIFGPVLSIMTFKNEAEALLLANDCEYGLASAIFGSNSDQLNKFSRQLEAGIVWINCSQPCFCELPWGGMKKSGNGRDLGPFGLHSYLEPKQICRYIADKPLGWYKSNL